MGSAVSSQSVYLAVLFFSWHGRALCAMPQCLLCHSQSAVRDARYDYGLHLRHCGHLYVAGPSSSSSSQPSPAVARQFLLL